ncbi:MAG TPA: hypothetical protein PLL56_14140 [Verrucomicrobiota bacterium]|nr:hypothetical protein [Verrucomicrobiota bacterium]
MINELAILSSCGFAKLVKTPAAKPERVIRTKKLPKIPKGAPYAATAVQLQRILIDFWAGSQAQMAVDTGLSLGLIVRMISAERPASSNSIGAVIGALPREHKALALDLMSAYLQDVADESHHGYQVSVEDIT